MPPCRRALASSSWRVSDMAIQSFRPTSVVPPWLARDAGFGDARGTWSSWAACRRLRSGWRRSRTSSRPCAPGQDALLLDVLDEEDVPGAGRHDRQHARMAQRNRVALVDDVAEAVRVLGRGVGRRQAALTAGAAGAGAACRQRAPSPAAAAGGRSSRRGLARYSGAIGARLESRTMAAAIVRFFEFIFHYSVLIPVSATDPNGWSIQGVTSDFH